MTSMDDGLILNLADTSLQTARKHASKGGRWTDRLKAKRSVKRKRPVSVRAPDQLVTSHEPMNVTADGEDSPRARKKPRRAIEAANIRKDSGTGSATLKAQPVQPRSQIISSLFTSNPSVEIREEGGTPLMISRPTNAPLADQTTFSGLGLNPLIGLHLASKLNIQKPTEIQREVLANLLSSPTGEALQRDLFISSQTGSGKTLAYLLPILQDLLPLSSLSYIDRTIGTLAIIIAPTRELAKQISEVLEKLLTLRLRQREDEADDDYSESTRLTRWLVSGLFSGGATRAHEKARIRKGLPIVVATPGRLLDHLQNTSTFNVSKCRWLVLDEADRLMDLGFEDTLKGILQALDGRRKLAMQAIESGQSTEVGGWEWNPRRTILVSATIREDVQHLAGTALVNPILIKAVGRQSQGPNSDVQSASQNSGNLVPTQGQFTPPAQLSQKYIIVPLKLRLVTLIALLRTILSQSGNSPAKIIVFLSCTNSVDYHWHVLGSSKIDGDEPDESNAGEESSSESDKNEEHQDRPNKSMEEKIRMNSPLLPGTSLYRLHGSLPLSTRLASLKGFNKVQKDTSSKQNSAVLFCTSVASRGLDLPLVRAVIQYDLPTENGVTEYVHRVGRTARAGKGGEAWSFVAPSEQGWVKWIEEGTQRHTGEQDSAITLRGTTLESVLRSGFGSANHEARATEVQLSFERWVLKDKTHGELARKAFQSSVRAYATHPASEKEIFHIRRLHLGHFAKAFALREAPSNVASSTQKPSGSKAVKARRQRPTEDNDQGTEKRMRDAVRAQGKSHKKDGVSRSSGVSEFQISGGYDLEELVAKR